MDKIKTSAWPLSYVFLIGVVMVLGLSPAFAGALAGLGNAGILVVVHLMATAALAAFLGNKRIKVAIVFLAVLMPWQPLLSMPLAQPLGSSGIKLLVATKEVYVAALVLVLLIKNGRRIRWGYADICAVIFLTAYFFYMIKSPAGLTSRVVSFKEGFMIAAFYFIGRLSLLTREEIVWLLRVVIAIAVFVAAFGYLERFIFNADAWRYIGAVEYLESKIETAQFGSLVLDGLPLNWYTFLGNEPVRRMVGPIGDATSLSRFLALPVIALLYIKGLAGSTKESALVKAALLLFLGCALTLTLGRGGQIIVLGGIIVLMFAKKPVLSIVIGIPVVLLAMAKLALFDIQSGSAVRHMAGLAKGVLSIVAAPLGNGLGTSGQMAVLYSANIAEKVSESYVGSLAYQMGVPGVLAYTAFFLALTVQFLKTYLRVRPFKGQDAGMALMAITFSAGIYLTSVLANSAIAPISAGLSLIYLGAFSGATEHKAST